MPASHARLFAAAVSLTLLSVTVPTPGYAQDDIRARGDRACKSDARRLCKHAFEGGDMAVLGCFQQNRTKLSDSCRRFLVEVGQLN